MDRTRPAKLYDYAGIVGSNPKPIPEYDSVVEFNRRESFADSSIEKLEDEETMLRKIIMLTGALESKFFDYVQIYFKIPDDDITRKEVEDEIQTTCTVMDSLLDMWIPNFDKFTSKVRRYRNDLDSDSMWWEVVLFYTVCGCMVNCTAFDMIHGEGANRKASDYKFAIDNKLPAVKEMIPISMYSMKKIMWAIKDVEAASVNCDYDSSMDQYVKMLFTRVAYIFRTSHTEESLELTAKVVTMYFSADYEEDGVKKLFCNTKFLEDMAWSFIGIQKKLYSCRITHRNCVLWKKELLIIKPEIIEDWITNIALETKNDEIEYSVKDEYLIHLIRPGEKMKFLRDFPDKAPSADRVLSKYRGKARIKMIRKKVANSIGGMVKDKSFELVGQDIIKSKIVAYWFSAYTQIKFWDYDAVVYSKHVIQKANIIMTSAEPYIVQSMNRFDVVMAGRLYKCKTFSESFGVWLDIVAKNNSKKYNKVDISTVYESIQKFAKRPPLQFESIDTTKQPPKRLSKDKKGRISLDF